MPKSFNYDCKLLGYWYFITLKGSALKAIKLTTSGYIKVERVSVSSQYSILFVRF